MKYLLTYIELKESAIKNDLPKKKKVSYRKMNIARGSADNTWSSSDSINNNINF